MISKQLLKDNLYEFIASPTFQQYLNLAKTNENYRLNYAPTLRVTGANREQYHLVIQLASNQKEVKVIEDEHHSKREVGFFDLVKEEKKVVKKTTKAKPTETKTTPKTTKAKSATKETTK